MRLTGLERWRERLTVVTGVLAWVGSLAVAAPAGAAVYCAKVKGTKPVKAVTLREGGCKKNEADVTADVVAQFVLQGEKGDPGPQGPTGESCTVADNGDGTHTVTCGGGSTAVLTDPGYVPAEYVAADPIQGGAAYSKWWVTQAGGPGTLGGAGVTAGVEWVRCKACHAWDGRGNAASYANRTGQSTGTASRPDVSTVDLWPTIRATTPTQMFDLIKGTGGRSLNTEGNGHPDFSAALSDAQIWSLVKFMREGWIFPDHLYFVAVEGPPVYKDATEAVIPPTVTYYGIGADGDAAVGDAIFASACSGCHGPDGTAIDLGGASLGEFVRNRPNETWHKAKFGEISNTSVASMQPGLVTDTRDLVDLYRALTNVAMYPDLP